VILFLQEIPIYFLLYRQRNTSTKYCDATLEVEGKKYAVHRAILGSVSEYFDKLFSSEVMSFATYEVQCVHFFHILTD